MSFFKMPTSLKLTTLRLRSQTLTESQSDAVRADFLAYNERTKDAQLLLDRVLHEEPNNVSAHETKGFIEFKQGHIEEAKKWYARAVELDSQSYLAHYYFAAMSMTERGDTAEQEKVEQSSEDGDQIESGICAFVRPAGRLSCIAQQKPG